MISNDTLNLPAGETVDEEEGVVNEKPGLYPGDSGELALDTRRALMQLLSGPFISGSKHSKLWSSLMQNEKVIHSRLSELFLDLVIDREQQVAFVRQAEVNGIDFPSLLRRSQLTFIDSAAILHLRKRLSQADAGGERAVISANELFDHLTVYEKSTSTDRAGFRKRVNASIEKLKKNNILQLIRQTKDRYEISPTLKLLFSTSEISSLIKLYEQLASGELTLDQRAITEPADSGDDNV